jgi:hydrogenase assembly chaperone HypC/HupF
VSFDGIEKNINIEVVNVKVGDYVVVHAGYAIEKLTKQDANDILLLFSKTKSQNK